MRLRHAALLLTLLLPASAGAARFAVYGDTRNHDAEHARIVSDLIAARPELALFTGDAVLDGNSEPQWKRFDEIERPFFSSTRIYGVRGNHDHGPAFAKAFRLPPQGTHAGPGGEYYSFDALGLHFLGLDSELPLLPGSEQLRFATEDLHAHTRQPIVVFLHRALFSSGHHGGDHDLQAALQPLFEETHVALVFQGHDHDYERSRPIHGVTYIVEGGGGADLRPFEGKPPEWSAVRYGGFGYVLVDVLPQALDVQAFDSAGTPIDRVSIPLAAAAAPQASDQRARRDRLVGLAIFGGLALLGIAGFLLLRRPRTP